MTDFFILNDKPRIRTFENVFSKNICEDIINWGKDKLGPSKIVDNVTGTPIVDSTIRSASVAIMDEKSPHYQHIVDIISDLTEIDSNRFEKLILTQYSIGGEYKTHHDFFNEKQINDEYKLENEKRCRHGGNRVSTIILYLNDVELGGETYFPWTGNNVVPKTGKLCQFDYNYEEPEYNIRTQHRAVEVVKGEKWIITIWVREQSLSQEVPNYKRFIQESEYFKDLEDINYSITCGPEWDLRDLNFSLPANNSADNVIVVAVTGGFESSLLLYLIAVLNSYQKIPYIISPTMIATKHENDIPHITENREAVEKLIDFINNKIEFRKVGKLHIIECDQQATGSKIINGLAKTLQNSRNSHRFVNMKYIYMGCNETPKDPARWGKNPLFTRKKSNDPKWIQPFFNLQKYHIIDLYIKLNLFEIFEIIGKCQFNHKTLTENCQSFACNERRWGFTKLGREDLGNKYFTIGE